MAEFDDVAKLTYDILDKRQRVYSEYRIKEWLGYDMKCLGYLSSQNYPSDLADLIHGLKVVYFYRNRPLCIDEFSEAISSLLHILKKYTNRLNVNKCISHLGVALIGQLVSLHGIDDIMLCANSFLELDYIGMQGIWSLVSNKIQSAIAELESSPDNFVKILEILIKCKRFPIDVSSLTNIMLIKILKYIEKLDCFDYNSTRMISLLEDLDTDQHTQRIQKIKNKCDQKILSGITICKNDSVTISDIRSICNVIHLLAPFYTSRFSPSKGKTEVFYLRSREGFNLAIKSEELITERSSIIQSEISILQTLSGQKLCFLTYFGTFSKDANIYIVTEYLSNTLQADMYSHSQLNCPYTEQEQLEITSSLIEGFAYMEAKGIYHRDIKPENILIDSKGVRIIDFSISTILKLGNSTSAEYSVQGTPDFAAPELKTLLMNKIITGEEIRAVYDIGKADVYSLGLTLLQVITLGDVDGFNNEEMQPRVNEIISRLNGWISRLLGKMLKFNPVERPTFANALAMVPMKETVIE